MRVCLFEDSQVLNLEPLSWTRPVFDLLCGRSSLATKQWQYFAPCERAVLIRPYLADLYRHLHPEIVTNDCQWLTTRPVVLVNGRWLPPRDRVIDLNGPYVAMLEGEIAYAILEPGHLAHCSPETMNDLLSQWKHNLPRKEAGGHFARYLWDLVDLNGKQLTQDFEQSSIGGERHWRPDVAIVGPLDGLRIDPTAKIDPMVVVDTTNGPVLIDHDAIVTAFSRLEGPCYIGPGAQVLGAKIRAGTTLGPQSRVGGEVEASIIQGNSNKYHDGFLGHSYVGEWVNLGAGTQNSDLRNDYGEVKLTVRGERIASGRNKAGCYLGDHTKSGLGTLLNTGTNAGIFCNLLPTAGLLPKYVPSFTNVWNGQLVENGDLVPLMETALKVMKRRSHDLSRAHVALYEHLFSTTAEQRRHALKEHAKRQLRKAG